jgi:hypothetical protein
MWAKFLFSASGTFFFQYPDGQARRESKDLGCRGISETPGVICWFLPDPVRSTFFFNCLDLFFFASTYNFIFQSDGYFDLYVLRFPQKIFMQQKLIVLHICQILDRSPNSRLNFLG